MLIDDHDQMYGGSENTVTVRISTEELTKLSQGELVKRQNKSGNKLNVILMLQDDPQPISAS